MDVLGVGYVKISVVVLGGENAVLSGTTVVPGCSDFARIVPPCLRAAGAQRPGPSDCGRDYPLQSDASITFTGWRASMWVKGFASEHRAAEEGHAENDMPLLRMAGAHLMPVDAIQISPRTSRKGFDALLHQLPIMSSRLSRSASSGSVSAANTPDDACPAHRSKLNTDTDDASSSRTMPRISSR